MSNEIADTIEIGPVQRTSAKLVIGLAGTSGSGKTYTALELAIGLAGGDPTKVGLLDTENRRGSLYADIFDKPFMIGDLMPPFSPARYITAMRQFASSGVKALVVDSMSHEWEGEGGCEEMADDGGKLPNWKRAKREHKKFMNALLLLPFHVVLCFRAREKSDFSNPRDIKSLGIQPICEKNVMFEMTVSFMLEDEGRRRTPLKSIPSQLRPIVGGEAGYLTRSHGKQLLAWVGGADPVEQTKGALRLAATNGTQSLIMAWTALSSQEKKALSAFKDTLKDTAAAADAEKTSDKGEPEPLADQPDIPWK